jgi:MFS family permease
VQLPRSTGFGFGASVLVSSLYLLPFSILMLPMSLIAAPLSARYGSRANLIAGAIISAGSVVLLAVAHDQPIDFLIASGLLGIGIGLAFAALGTLIVHAVPAHQTGVASGMNTVMRQIGGATGAQVAGTLVAAHTIHGIATVTGFVNSFVLDAALLAIAVLAALAVPQLGRRDSLPAQRPPGTPAVKAP